MTSNPNNPYVSSISDIEARIETFSDNNLEKLQKIVNEEIQKRHNTRFIKGDFQPFNNDELDQLKFSENRAIQSYRERTGESFLFTRHLVETYLPR